MKALNWPLLLIDVESKKTSLIDVVQSLGEYINDEDPILRGKAVSYLTAVIKALSPKFLSRQQIQVLTTFFCDRIEDGGAVAGLDTLQRLDRFYKDLADMVARSWVLYVCASKLAFGMLGKMANVEQHLCEFPGFTVSVAVAEVSGLPIAEWIDVEPPCWYV